MESRNINSLVKTGNIQSYLRRAKTFVSQSNTKMERLESDFQSGDDELENVFQAEDEAHVFVNPDPDASKPSEKFDYAESVVSSIESEFKNMPDVSEDRKRHKEELRAKLADLNKQLKKKKNIKNHKMRAQNAVIAKQRAEIRKQIESVKDDLYAIDMEEAGDDVSSASLVDTVLHKQTPEKPPINRSFTSGTIYGPGNIFSTAGTPIGINANNANLFTKGFGSGIEEMTDSFKF